MQNSILNSEESSLWKTPKGYEVNKMKFLIDAHPELVKKIRKIKSDLNIGHISDKDFVTVMFIGSMYMLERKNDTMVDFVLANTSLDS